MTELSKPLLILLTLHRSAHDEQSEQATFTLAPAF